MAKGNKERSRGRFLDGEQGVQLQTCRETIGFGGRCSSPRRSSIWHHRPVGVFQFQIDWRQGFGLIVTVSLVDEVDASSITRRVPSCNFDPIPINRESAIRGNHSPPVVTWAWGPRRRGQSILDGISKR